MQDGKTPLMAATSSEEEHLEVVRLLMDRGADVNASAKVVTWWFSANSFKHLENSPAMLKALRECWGILLSSTNSELSFLQDGATALQTSCVKGHTATTLLLLESKAEVDQMDEVCTLEAHPNALAHTQRCE